MYKIKRFSVFSKVKGAWNKLGKKGKIAAGSAATLATAAGAKAAYDKRDKLRERAIGIYQSAKHAVTHPKETGKKIANYIRRNPDEAAAVIGSNIIPGVVAARLAKKGNMKGAAIAGAVTALPIGETYVAAKAVRRARMKNKNDN